LSLPCVGAGAAGSAWAGSEATAPISSSTTGAFANGSVGVGETTVCVSETTGTTRCFAAVFGRARVGAMVGASVRLWTAGSGGSAGSAWTRGIRSSGSGSVASDSAGSGVAPDVDARNAGCRKTAATGPTYIETRTRTPMLAQQYRKPRLRTATIPYLLDAATAAYARVFSLPAPPAGNTFTRVDGIQVLSPSGYIAYQRNPSTNTPTSKGHDERPDRSDGRRGRSTNRRVAPRCGHCD
jgi:hypothetical protein